MSLAVFRRTLVDARGLLLGLACGLATVSALFGAMFPSFREQAALVERLLPSFVRLMFSAVPLDKPEGFVSWGFQHPLWVALALTWPIAAAAAAIAGEIERGTLGWVLAQPLSRTRYYFSRAAALLVGETAILASGVATFAIVFYALGLAPRAGLSGILLAGLEVWLLCEAFGAVCLAVSALTSEAGRVYSVGIGLAVASLLLSIVGDMWAAARPFKPLSLFAYFDPYDALRGNPLAPASLLVPLVVLILALFVGWRAFLRRDLAI